MRLIDADALKKDLTRFYDNEVTAKRLIDEQPTIEPEPHWIPCSERLPEPRKAVIGYAPRYQNIYALYYDSAYGWMIWKGGAGIGRRRRRTGECLNISYGSKRTKTV